MRSYILLEILPTNFLIEKFVKHNTKNVALHFPYVKLMRSYVPFLIYSSVFSITLRESHNLVENTLE